MLGLFSRCFFQIIAINCCLYFFKSLETQLSKLEEEKLKLLMEISDFRSTVQTLKEELDEAKHKSEHLIREKETLLERLKAEESAREKVSLEAFLPSSFLKCCSFVSFYCLIKEGQQLLGR